MPKEYRVRCPYCDNVRKMILSDMLGSMATTTGMRGTAEEKPELPSPESLDEENWIDLKNPCRICKHKFSFNIVSGESRE